MTISRREILTAGASIVLANSAIARGIADACGITPAQIEGPFYPIKNQADKDNDLTVKKGGTRVALGSIVYLAGRVLDPECAPITNALVEIWQACASGRYDHPSDTSGNPLDPDFQYWGRAFTDGEGRYDFKTIEPGKYLAEENWTRPPHIHFKVSRSGFKKLTTQMYFGGNKYNESDLLLNELPEEERRRLIVDFSPAGAGFEVDARRGTFDITLRR